MSTKVHGASRSEGSQSIPILSLLAAVVISQKAINAILKGRGEFVHGQTYQGMPWKSSE